MNRDQAAEILEWLLEAAHGLDEAKAAAAVLADHDADAASVRGLIIRLNSELLVAIFDRFPDLIPFEEFPEISSSLRWDHVQLPLSASESEIDRIILAVVAPGWLKMARVVGDAVGQGKSSLLEFQTKCLLPAFRRSLKPIGLKAKAISANGAIAK